MAHYCEECQQEVGRDNHGNCECCWKEVYEIADTNFAAWGETGYPPEED